MNISEQTGDFNLVKSGPFRTMLGPFGRKSAVVERETSSGRPLDSGRPECTAKALAIDVRRRVAAVVEGMSRRHAAVRLGVSAGRALLRWHQRLKSSGAVAPSKHGKDRRSGQIEARGPVILGLVSE